MRIEGQKLQGTFDLYADNDRLVCARKAHESEISIDLNTLAEIAVRACYWKYLMMVYVGGLEFFQVDSMPIARRTCAR